jgi:hypothetical protein
MKALFLSGDVLPLYLILVFLHYLDEVQMDREDSISLYSMHFKEGETLHYNTQQEYDELITTKLNVLIVQLTDTIYKSTDKGTRLKCKVISLRVRGDP